MFYDLPADTTVLLHGLFVLFVIFGGLVALWRPRTVWLHLPAAIWGIAVELTGWICPLTHLENQWRQKAGAVGYREGFIQHYLEPFIYPSGLTPSAQFRLGLLALLLNTIIYAGIWNKYRKKPQEPSGQNSR